MIGRGEGQEKSPFPSVFLGGLLGGFCCQERICGILGENGFRGCVVLGDLERVLGLGCPGLENSQTEVVKVFSLGFEKGNGIVSRQSVSANVAANRECDF